MKHLKKFDNNSSYEEYILGEDFIIPNVSYVEEDSKVYYNPLQSSNNDPYVEQGWMRLTYDAKEGQVVNVLNTKYDLSNVSKMAVRTNNSLSRAADELIEITPSSSYTFEKEGRNQLYIRFIDDIEIPAYTYYGCKELVEVLMSDKVKTIGDSAFYNCVGLTEITFPNSVQTIGNRAFSGCTGLKGVIIGENVQTIEEYAFEECSGMTEVTISSSVKTIGDGAFPAANLTKITSLAMTAPEIGEYTFLVATVQEGTLYIPIGAIGYDAWMSANPGYLGLGGWKCLELDNYVCENGLYYSLDGKKLFAAEKTISGAVNIKEGVEKICTSAFIWCTGLKEVTIPASVTEIGEDAFTYCMGLSKITSHALSAPTIYANTFTNVGGNGKLYIPEGATGYEIWMQNSDGISGYLGYKNWTMQTISE